MNPTRSFANFRTDVFRLHEQGQYDRALELVAREAATFPEETSGITLWRICLLARRGDTNAAIETMARAVETGWWRAERILRRDEDLAQLQGLPEFERLVSGCRGREQAAQAHAKPDLTVLAPDSAPPATGYPLLVAFHGFGGNLADFGAAWQRVPDQGWLVALPQASQVVDWEGFSWDDWELAAAQLQEHYRALCRSYRIDASRVVLAGFSQGGTIATWLALCGLPAAGAGVFAIVPGARHPETFLEPARACKIRPRVYIVMGHRDFAAGGVRRFVATLESAGIPITVDERPDLDHELPPNLEETAARALEFITSVKA